MTIAMKCPNCGRDLQFSDDSAGDRLLCGHCGTELQQDRPTGDLPDRDQDGLEEPRNHRGEPRPDPVPGPDFGSQPAPAPAPGSQPRARHPRPEGLRRPITLGTAILAWVLVSAGIVVLGSVLWFIFGDSADVTAPVPIRDVPVADDRDPDAPLGTLPNLEEAMEPPRLEASESSDFATETPAREADVLNEADWPTSIVSYPPLPPAPTAPAGGEPLRDDVLASHELLLREQLGAAGRIADILDPIRGVEAAEAALARLNLALEQATRAAQALRRLPTPNQAERRALSRRLGGSASTLHQRLEQELEQIRRSPQSLELNAALSETLFKIGVLADSLRELARRDGSGSGEGVFAEVLVSAVPNARASRDIASTLERLAEGPGGVQSAYDPATGRASYRLWPVSELDALARRIPFGRARVAGPFVSVALGAPSPPDPIERPGDPATPSPAMPAKPPTPTTMPPREAIAPPVSPTAAPGEGRSAMGTRIERGLTLLASPSPADRRQGLMELGLATPVEESRDRVVKAAIPFALGADQDLAHGAVRVLGRWGNDEAVGTLIRVVETEEDPVVRQEAIRQLERLGASSAAPAVARRLEDDGTVARLALKAFGAEAEDAILSLLDDPEPGIRITAIHLLRDIGGARSYEAITRALRDDPDESVRREAARALRTIGIRLGR